MMVMREIKFRAWYKGEENPIYLDDVELYEKYEKPQMIYNVQNLYDGNIGSAILGGYSSFGSLLNDDDFIIMQYTGFRDKNNKEIYEGDIVRVMHMLVETIPPYDAVVEWDKFRYALRCLDENVFTESFVVYPLLNFDPFGLDLEVIGNIYENPELIKM
jgi:uncharacterized phage protein (TIGR01671 family)